MEEAGRSRLGAVEWGGRPVPTNPPSGESELLLPAQAQGVSQREHRPDGREDDQCEKKKFGGNTGPLALRVAFAEEARKAQTHRSFRITQLTTSPMAA